MLDADSGRDERLIVDLLRIKALPNMLGEMRGWLRLGLTSRRSSIRNLTVYNTISGTAFLYLDRMGRDG